MKQQINFYRLHRPSREFQVKARTIAWAGLGTVMVLVGATLFDRWELRRLRQQVEVAQQQVQFQQAQVQQLQAQIPEPKADPQLSAQTDIRQREVDDLKRLLSAVKGDEWQSQGGFAAYFEDLARQTWADVWLRTIRFSEGGKKIELAGSALMSDSIPLMVQRLGNESSFKSRTFAELAIDRPAGKPGQVDFLLRTHLSEKDKNGKP